MIVVLEDFGLCDYYDKGWSLMCSMKKGAGVWLETGDLQISYATAGFSDGMADDLGRERGEVCAACSKKGR